MQSQKWNSQQELELIDHSNILQIASSLTKGVSIMTAKPRNRKYEWKSTNGYISTISHSSTGLSPKVFRPLCQLLPRAIFAKSLISLS